MLTRETLELFKVAMAQASRTTDYGDASLSGRFVELRPGMLAVLGTNVNHLLTGRRGVGKSTTLAVLQQQARANGAKVIVVDVETHKDRLYPDVLIEIMMDVLDELSISRHWWGHKRTFMRDVRHLKLILRALRDSAPETIINSESMDETKHEMGVTLNGKAASNFARLSARAGASSGSVSKKTRVSKIIRRKEDFLRDIAPTIASILERAAGLQGSTSLLLVLDDFYFVKREAQPLVLDHLHGMTKRSNVWLKIGSVKSRTQTFSDGNPPLGMQPPHDLRHLSLDVGLSDFYTAMSFLEQVAKGVLDPIQLSLKDIVTETARERAVLIAGGAVARDYFELLDSAADVSWEESQNGASPSVAFKIDAEHVQKAASLLLDRKRMDLRNDAGRDSVRLEGRLDDLIAFARQEKTYFFLIEQDSLDSDWGREVQELEDLRFVHRIMTTRPNTGKWRGVDTVVFMMDIPTLVRKRMTRAPVSFWKPDEVDKVRRAQWIYKPDRLSKVAPPGGTANIDSSTTEAMQEELPFE